MLEDIKLSRHGTFYGNLLATWDTIMGTEQLAQELWASNQRHWHCATAGPKGLVIENEGKGQWYFGHLKWRTDSFERTWCWERLKVGGEGNNRGWDGWMASPTWSSLSWVWVSFRSWWWTGRPGMLQSKGLQRVRHDWVTELNWTERGQGSCYYQNDFWKTWLLIHTLKEVEAVD